MKRDKFVRKIIVGENDKIKISLTNKVNVRQVCKFLNKCDKMFTVPLSERGVDLKAYAEKIVLKGKVIAIRKWNKTIGFISYYANDLINKKGHITLLCVLPDYRGLGLARILLDACISDCKSVGMEKITLEVYKNNTSAYSLYSKYGFTVISGEEHLLLGLELNKQRAK